jgi:ubiquinone biosynthesis protein
LRVLEYFRILLKYRLEHLIPNQILKNLGLFRSVFKITPVTGPLPFRIRKALEEGGPVFIKLGQLMSTRQDVFGPSIINELKLLQDNVSPVDYKQIKPLIESIPLEFKQIDNDPAAVGSVAQVYFATLHDGTEVAIKIIKPNIDHIIDEDFKFLKKSSELLNLIKSLRKVKLPVIINELHQSIKKELDLNVEKNNIERFTRQMQKFDFIKIPKVFYSSKNVLILERMYGTPIDQKQDLINKNIDIVKMLNQGLEAFIVQSFYYGFYHADPHPGNVWIDDSGKRIYLDFGIMGEINKQDRETILRLLVMIYNKKYSSIKDLIKSSGWTDSNLEGIETDLEKMILTLNVKSAKELDIAGILSKLLDVLNVYDVNIPAHMILFIKTLVAVDGFSKSLAPSNDVIKSLIPIIVKHFSKFSR